MDVTHRESGAFHINWKEDTRAAAEILMSQLPPCSRGGRCVQLGRGLFGFVLGTCDQDGRLGIRQRRERRNTLGVRGRTIFRKRARRCGITRILHLVAADSGGRIRRHHCNPGLIGCLPSKKLLEAWNKPRSEIYLATNPKRVPPHRGVAVSRDGLPSFGSPMSRTKAKKGPRRSLHAPVPPANTVAIATSRISGRGSPCLLSSYVKGAGLSMG